ncbi:PACE efflux transporter [Rhodobacteraceae bacterium S2214]|nr:PACE efflux transporter [Rhodobacteraceae bacterium S2214]
MANNTALRSGRERVQYTVAFEVILMAILVPAGALLLDKSIAEVGVLGVILVLKAMVMGLIYNWVFDRFDAKSGRVASDRSTMGRILHAVGFEMSLLITSIPIYMWWFDFSMLQAISTDIVVTTFVVGYTYVFSLVYDRKFPVGSR